MQQKMGRKPVKYAVVDAFSELEFKGNPAAVCLLEEQRSEDWLKLVASEFNLPVTCYLTRITDSSSSNHDSSVSRFNLRWFCSSFLEVKLCGHATMAAAHFCFWSGLVQRSSIIEFSTLSGILTAKKVEYCENVRGLEHCIELNLPQIPLIDYNTDETHWSFSKALGGVSATDMKIMTNGNEIFVVLPSAKYVTELEPNFEDIRKCPGGGLIISAPAPPESRFDFFSRCFFPKIGVNEDQVCGSAHCALVGYWSKKLEKTDFLAYVASPRSGILKLHLDESNGRVTLKGKAITVMEGSILV